MKSPNYFIIGYRDNYPGDPTLVMQFSGNASHKVANALRKFINKNIKGEENKIWDVNVRT